MSDREHARYSFGLAAFLGACSLGFAAADDKGASVCCFFGTIAFLMLAQVFAERDGL